MIPVVYYINLDRSKDRLRNIYNQQIRTGIEFTRIRGVDGKQLSREEKEKNCSLFCQNFCTPSMIGCFMSHKAAWNTIGSGKNKWAVVIEDDCVLRKDFVIQIKKVVKELNAKEPDWDFIYLGSLSFNEVPFLPTIKTRQRFKSKTYTVPTRPMGFHCYAISIAGAKKLLSVFKKIDYHVDLMFLLNNHHFKVFASKRKLGYQPTSCDSSTLNENKFPSVINSVIDKHGIKKDNVSLSYHLSAPIVRLPLLNVNINAYIVLMVILLLSSKQFRPYIYIYLMYELITSNSEIDKDFILKWMLVFFSFF